MVANHLPTEDMLDIALYSSRFNLLSMSRLSPLGGSMIWQEVCYLAEYCRFFAKVLLLALLVSQSMILLSNFSFCKVVPSLML